MRNSKDMHIMHLVTGLNVGGAEKVVLDLSIAQKNSGLYPIVVSITHYDKLLPVFKKYGIEVFFLKIKKNPVSFFRSLKRLNILLKHKEIDILHCHMFHPILYATFLKIFRKRIKIVFTSHSFNIGSSFRNIICFCSQSVML